MFIKISHPVNQTHNDQTSLDSDIQAEATSTDAVTEDSKNAEGEAIAVIGMSLKFPQEATSPEAFWEMLHEGRCAMTEFPKDRFNIDGFYQKDRPENGTLPLRGGHFLKEDLGAFDATFFSVTPAEALAMDPQQRMMLETSYTALENAGLPMDECSGSRTSVYTATFTDDYKSMLQQDPEQLPRYAATGLSGSMLANRVSWFFNFHGPSMNLDSACSSSLSALHIACQDLLNGTSNMALVGGCNLVFHPDFMLIMSNMSFLSPDSRCWSFDHRANGYARGEGFGVVVLKKLSDALKDGDTIRSVIRATGLNQDGKTPGGITQPNGKAQQALIEETFAKSNLDMAQVRFFEAHGTGTAIGDPIESSAIGDSFRSFRSEEEPLYVGAVKSNIGHLEGGSGIAGLIKTVLILEKGIILPNTGLEKINPKIDTQKLRIKFPTSPIQWPTTGLRRACINSFGFGGSNAVVIVDDALHFLQLHGLTGNHRTVELRPRHLNTITDAASDNLDQVDRIIGEGVKEIADKIKLQDPLDSSPQTFEPRILIFSGADEVGIKNMLSSYAEFFHQRSELVLNSIFHDLVYTLGVKRSVLAWRSYAIASSGSDMKLLQNHSSKPIRSSGDLKGMAFVFTGQGGAYKRMGVGLLAFPLFKRRFAELEQILYDLGCEWSLMGLLQDSSSDVNEPEYSQTFSTALQIAIVDLLRSFNVTPAAVVGHSSGEVAAAYCAGAISTRSAMGIAFHRGRLAGKLPKLHATPQAMLATSLSEEDVQPFLARLGPNSGAPNVQIGCINSPKSITLTGDKTQLETLESWLKKDQHFARQLRVNVAYHSSFMNAIECDYLKSLHALDMKVPRHPSLPIISSVTGNVLPPRRLSDPKYWVTNLISQVKFSQAVSLLCLQSGKKPRKHLGSTSQSLAGIKEIVEIGPSSTLQGPLLEILSKADPQHRMSYVSILNRQKDAAESALEAVGRLWSLGYPVDIAKANGFNNRTSQTMLTDLPSYLFNHTQRHWYEDRTSAAFRFRSHPRHELLGSLIPTSSTFEMRWRNFLSLEKVQWVQDHHISNDCLLPGAAMLAMAIEAVKQISDQIVQSVGFDIREVQFLNALQVPESIEGIEIQASLTTTRSQAADNAPWYVYRLFSVSSEWVEHCRCKIRVETRRPSGFDTIYHQELSSVIETCTEDAEIEKFYDRCRDNGVDYGPIFQTLGNVRFDRSGAAVAEIKAFSTRSDDKSKSLHFDKYTIHPSVLDGLLQLVFPALNNGGTQELPAMVPSTIRKLLIYSNESVSCSTSHLLASTKSTFNGYRGTESNVIALSAESGELFSVMEGYQTTFVSASKVSSNRDAQRPLLSHLEWKPDVALLSSEQIAKLCEQARPEDNDRLHSQQRLLVLFQHYFSAIIESLQSYTSSVKSPQVARYIEWLEQRQKGLNEQNCCLPTSEESNISPLDETTSQSIVELVKGETSFEDFAEMANSYLQKQLTSSKIQKQIDVFISLLAHKNPLMNVLELGGGMGDTASPCIKAFSADGTMHCLRYDYTDLSPDRSFKSHERLGSLDNRIHFQVLDIENDLADQGFEKSSYDLIIAAHAYQSTSDVSKTLKTLRSLLKPGGKLLIVGSGVPKYMRIDSVFERLSGFSLYSFGDDLSKTLTDNGFKGIDFSLYDCEDCDFQEIGIIVATVSEKIVPNAVKFPEIAIIIDQKSTVQSDFAICLKEKIAEAENTPSTIYDFGDAVSNRSIARAFCIFLLECEVPFLASLSSEDFDNFKNVLSLTKDILWVVKDTQELRRPEFHLVDGLSRALRSEDPKLRFARVALQDDTQTDLDGTTAILGVLRHAIKSPLDDMEPEYEVRDGMLCINRVVQSQQMNNLISAKIASHQEQELQLNHGVPLTASLKTPGMIKSIIYEEVADSSGRIEADEVVIQVRAVGLTSRDYQIASGKLNDNRIFSEASGIVSYAGSESGFFPGDKVLVSYSGSCKTLLKCEASFVAPIPSQLSFVEAAGLPTSSLMTFHALINTANLAKDEFVWIQNAAGALGQAAIQISQSVGARIIVTTTSKDLLRETYDLPEERILSTSDPDLSRTILEVTGGRGLDVILCFESGEILDVSMEVLAPFGRLLNLGLDNDAVSANISKRVSSKCISYTSLDLAEIQRLRPHMIKKIFAQVSPLIRDGIIKPATPLDIYEACDIEQALQSFQGRRNTGKVVIDLDPKLSVPALVKNIPSYHFDPNATYLIAGGFGGLGRSVSRWMVDRGARNLIILARSGTKSESAKKLVGELEALGARVEAPACDIIQAESLRSVLKECSKILPPIRGCFQCTMVLRDAIFDNMTHDDFITGTRPKVQGSWNLHTLLPNGMDFFVFLSSIGGILGATSQANYCAGNTSMDALARYRTTIGEKAISIDLGMMISEGVVAETEGMLDSLRRLGYFMDITQAEFLALLDYYCDPSLPLLRPSESQIIVGIEHPAAMEAKNLEVPHWMTRPLFRYFSLINRDSDGTSSKKLSTDSETVLKQSASTEIAVEHTVEWIVTKVSQILGTKAEEMDVNKPVHINGINSLVAVELRNWFDKKIGADVAVFEILGNMSIVDLAKYAVGKTRYRL